MTTPNPATRINDAFPEGEASCDLTVVIPSYNTRDLMEQAMRTVEEASGDLSVEIIVVDNASHDGSQQMVRDRFPHVELICNDSNLGFAGANNLAFRQARGRHILLLNSDTIVRPDTLKTMVGFLDDHPEVGAAGCKILNPDGTLQLDCRRSFPTPSAAIYKLTGLSRLFPNSQRFGRYNLTFLDEDEVAEVDALSGSCMLVRRQALQQVGGLDEAYFMYGEDLDWCYRMRGAGWKIFYVPTTEIIHFRGESGRSRALRIQFRKNEAMAIFVHKHMRRRYRLFPVWLLHVGIVAYSLYAFIKPLLRRFLLPAVDATLLLVGVWLGIALRYHPILEPGIRAIEGVSRGLGVDVEPTRWLVPPAYSDAQWIVVYAAPVAIWIVTLALLGVYDRRRYSPGRAILGVSLGFAIIITTVFFFKDYNFSRLAAAAAWGCNTLLVGGWRWGARRLSGASTGGRLGRRRLLVVGTDEAAESLVSALAGWGGLDSQLVGLVSTASDQRGQDVADHPVVGLVDELPGLVKEYDIDELIFTATSVSDALRYATARPARLRLRMVSGQVDATSPAPTSIDELPLIDIRPGT
tara:strand:- start:1066 stop:2802 length:1737 start_codon:yes stop_codon:yes gene_type:complete